ncbi:MAG: glutathione S-transferase N-terminal domain-containing protein [Burkholderiales bacterium]|jgi:glutathione S-transferase|nr:glutathione S-transferase N-terminal domain-containing protein [Burkholderiales bacterium]
MNLYYTPTSPFARWVVVTILECHLPKPNLVVADPWVFPKALVESNPFSTVPALTTDDNETIVESLLIVQYLFRASASKSNKTKMSHELPLLGYAKLLLETAFRNVSLANHHPDHKTSHPFIARTQTMLTQALEKLPQYLPKTPLFNHPAHLHLAVALDYLSFRKPMLADQFLDEAARVFLSPFLERESFTKTSPKNFGTLLL